MNEVKNGMAPEQRFDGGLRELALFAGIGGGILGGKLLGWRTVCAVEINTYCCRRLLQRQNEGHLPPFPIWDDVLTFDGRPWRGLVDVVSGGFPCTDISAAGKGAGIEGRNSGLWKEFARIIGEVRPKYAFVENSPLLSSRGLHRVLGDLAEMGYDAGWCVLGANDIGAPHIRKRIWILAHAQGLAEREQTNKTDTVSVGWKTWDEFSHCSPLELGNSNSQRPQTCGPGRDSGLPKPKTQNNISEAKGSGGSKRDVGDANGLRELQPEGGECNKRRWPSDTGWWGAEPGICRVVDECPHRVDRLKALGNAQVSGVARFAWETLMKRIGT